MRGQRRRSIRPEQLSETIVRAECAVLAPNHLQRIWQRAHGRTDRYKLINRYPYAGVQFPDELYDLQEDPRETINRHDDPALKQVVRTSRWNWIVFLRRTPFRVTMVWIWQINRSLPGTARGSRRKKNMAARLMPIIRKTPGRQIQLNRRRQIHERISSPQLSGKKSMCKKLARICGRLDRSGPCRNLDSERGRLHTGASHGAKTQHRFHPVRRFGLEIEKRLVD